jgi:MazG family protein
MHSDIPASFDGLVALVRRLRSPGGCPWDIAQTPRTLRGGIVEEAWECVSAVDAGDDANLREELGDLLLDTALLAVVKEQEGAFTLEDVLRGICQKVIRRHPHIFADAVADTPAEVLAQWQRIKDGEKGRDRPASALDGLPGSLPPLERAFGVQKKAARVGFDWGEAAPVWDKLHEETAELREAVASADAARVEDEVGDLLFTVVNLARLLDTDPGLALAATVRKFERRFRGVEERLRAEATTPGEAGLARMDAIWNQLKAEERGAPGPAGAEGATEAHSTSK